MPGAFELFLLLLLLLLMPFFMLCDDTAWSSCWRLASFWKCPSGWSWHPRECIWTYVNQLMSGQWSALLMSAAGTPSLVRVWD